MTEADLKAGRQVGEDPSRSATSPDVADLDPSKITTGNRSGRRFAWILLGLAVTIFLVALLLLLLVPEHTRGVNDYWSDYRLAFTLLAYSVLGTLIIARQPKSVVGWIFCAMGLGWQLRVLGIGYLTYARFYSPSSIHAALVIYILLIDLGITQHALGPLALLSFPDGKLPSPRWRFVAWFPIVLGVVWYLLFTPEPVTGIPASQYYPPIQLIFRNINPGFSAASATALHAIFEVFFILAALGIVMRLGRTKGEQREQLKWCVYAAVVSATTLGMLESLQAARILGPGVVESPFFGILNDLLELLVPMALLIAISRYRLYDIDLIINRTLVYVPLTAVLAGLYAASVTLIQKLFIASTGQKSDAAVVMSTLILATAFTPIKNGLQDAVDKRFKEPKDSLKELKTFDRQIEMVAEVINTRRTVRRLLDLAMSAFQASCGAIYLKRDGALVPAQTSDGWEQGCGILSVPIEQDGVQLGVLVLGARNDRRVYSSEDRKMLQQAAGHVAEMIWFTQEAVRVGLH